MKLLIVDDEELTKAGLISAVDWKSIGITEIFQANDGVNGLAAALEKHPDIVLCDVRMPRMDGITMLERIQAKYPDITAIFMSGYADKEYLKAAIKLKAINYIEKPIDLNEIQDTICRAVEQCNTRFMQYDANAAQLNMAASQLAFELTVPYSTCSETVDSLCAKFHQHYHCDKFKNITTFIIKLEHLPENPNELFTIHKELKEYLSSMHLHTIYCEKRMYHIVFHVYGDMAPSTQTCSLIAQKLGSFFSGYGHYYIAIGNTVQGIANAFRSYESAVILLQSSYFFEPDTTLTHELIDSCSHFNPDNFSLHSASYIHALEKEDEQTAHFALARIKECCSRIQGLMANQLKGAYYDLFSELYKARHEKQLLPDLSLENHDTIMDIMDSCFSFSMLHDILIEKTDLYFQDITSQEPENATVYLIRNYISKHYKEPTLSVKDISEYAHLSTSYVCTFFKNETGSTLNQYITEFRMEKAKQLLADPRYRISDISAAVGYNDGNYFGKSFRKSSGLSPSEYREKVLH